MFALIYVLCVYTIYTPQSTTHYITYIDYIKKNYNEPVRIINDRVSFYLFGGWFFVWVIFSKTYRIVCFNLKFLLCARVIC